MSLRPRFCAILILMIATGALAACSAGSATGATAAPSPTPRTAAAPADTSQAADGRRSAFAGAPGADTANTLAGTIASVSASAITVDTQRGPLRLTIDADTRVTRVVGVTSDDLRVGESATVIGSRNAEGTITARTISLSDQPTAFDDRRQALPDAGGARISGTPPAGQGRLGDGFPRISGTPGSDPGQSGQGVGAGPGGPGTGGTLTQEQVEQFVQEAVASGRITQEQATSLRERLQNRSTPDAGGFRQGGRAVGRISARDGSTLTIDEAAGQVKIALAGDTRIQRIETVAPVELAVGTSVSVAAERGADGVVRATAIFVGIETGADSGFGAGRRIQP
jgi:hypothetical protein